MSNATWLIWLIVVLIIASVVIAGSRKFTLSWISSMALGVLAIGGTLGGLYLFREHTSPTPVNITITSPSNGAEVTGNRLHVAGLVSPPAAHVTLVVRSQTDLRWWAQSVVHSNATGGWDIDAYIGSPDMGKNQNFQIIALASADSLFFNLLTGRVVSTGDTFNTVPLWSQSDTLVVRRIN